MSKMRALLVLPLTLGLSADPIDIKEWTVPYGGHPRDPFVDASGIVWFVGQQGHYIGRLDPKTGEFKKFDLEPGAGPHNVVVDVDGAVAPTYNQGEIAGAVLMSSVLSYATHAALA